jgi:hypothetical protein
MHYRDISATGNSHLPAYFARLFSFSGRILLGITLFQADGKRGVRHEVSL